MNLPMRIDEVPRSFVERLPTVADLRPKRLRFTTATLAQLHFHDARTAFVGSQQLSLAPWAVRELRRAFTADPGARGWTGSPNEPSGNGPNGWPFQEANRRLRAEPGRPCMLVTEPVSTRADRLRTLADPNRPPFFEGDLLQEVHRCRHIRAGTLRVARLETTPTATHLMLVDPHPITLGERRFPNLYYPSLFLRGLGDRPGEILVGTAWFHEETRSSLVTQEKAVRVTTSADNRPADGSLDKLLIETFEAWRGSVHAERERLEWAHAEQVSQPSLLASTVLKPLMPTVPAALITSSIMLAGNHGPRTRLETAATLAHLAYAKAADPDVRFRIEYAAGELLRRPTPHPT